MITSARSVAFVGMLGVPVDVEVDIAQGLQQFHVVGMPTVAVKEAVRRVRSALTNSGIQWPQRRVTANLAPSDLKKEGSHFDLPLAVGVAAASRQIKSDRLSGTVLMGELSLDGKVRPVRGVLAGALAARSCGARSVVVPAANASEAALVDGLDVFPVGSLFEALTFLNGELSIASAPRTLLDPAAAHQEVDLSQVRGQSLAKRAIEIAAAGQHNLLLVGPPGCGKTMLARRIPTIMAPLSREESLEVTHVWSVAGLLGPGASPIPQPPFRAPHHHASPAAVIGGGSPWPRPGEVSLAHRGVLFCDEFPLFSRAVVDALRQPLEDGAVTIARMGATLVFPARTMLVAAANPCLCGGAGVSGSECTCPSARLENYRSRLSGPLLDRVDLHVEVARIDEDELFELPAGEPSAVVRERVLAARRFRESRLSIGDAGSDDQNYSPAAKSVMRRAARAHGLSVRAIDRTMRVARTIADLDASHSVEAEHIEEAVQFRQRVWR